MLGALRALGIDLPSPTTSSTAPTPQTELTSAACASSDSTPPTTPPTTAARTNHAADRQL